MPEPKPTKAVRRRMGPQEDEAFLARWSRRKEAVKAGEALEEPDDQFPPVAVPEEAGEETTADIDLESLPDIETLNKDSDFHLFMQKGIPDELRNKALRKLWRTDPVLANVDGLVDYGEDFTGDGLAGKALKTAWKVGRGYLTDEEVAELPGAPEEPVDEEAETASAAESTPDDGQSTGDDAEVIEKS